jgi:methylglutaconyl-CoA hydratase
MSAITQGDVVLSTNPRGIATIEFSHPMSNSLPGRILSKLVETITKAGNDTAIKVIILKSAGDRVFCAGASFEELSSIDNIEKGKEFFSGFANVINAARKCPKLIIGRVQGKAVGGGVGMASAVDYCFATKHASIKLSELALGIGPFVVGPAVARKTGLSSMSMMAINATKWFSANWAEKAGLYADVFETTQEMDDKIIELSNKLASSNPAAMENLKKVLWEGTENWDTLLAKRAEISGELVLSDFSKNAINALKKV